MARTLKCRECGEVLDEINSLMHSNSHEDDYYIEVEEL